MVHQEAEVDVYVDAEVAGEGTLHRNTHHSHARAENIDSNGTRGDKTANGTSEDVSLDNYMI